MQALIVEFVIEPGHVAAFGDAIIENARQSRETEPGCRQFDVCRDPAQPQLFFLYELYDDETAVQAHLQSTHFLQMNAATATWVQRKTVRRFERVAP
jgi:autoinducer 2-degrading protein